MCNIDSEGRISVGPGPRPLSIDIDHGLSHSTVEVKDVVLPIFRVAGDGSRIISFPYPGQGTGAPALFRLLLLAILLDGYILQVPFLVEGSANGPIVGHRDSLPRDAVVGELPVLQIYTLAVLGYTHQRQKRQCHEGNLLYHHSSIYIRLYTLFGCKNNVNKCIFNLFSNFLVKYFAVSRKGRIFVIVILKTIFLP